MHSLLTDTHIKSTHFTSCLKTTIFAFQTKLMQKFIKIRVSSANKLQCLVHSRDRSHLRRRVPESTLPTSSNSCWHTSSVPEAPPVPTSNPRRCLCETRKALYSTLRPECWLWTSSKGAPRAPAVPRAASPQPRDHSPTPFKYSSLDTIPTLKVSMWV